MTLPPKALNVLVDLKRELLSREMLPMGRVIAVDTEKKTVAFVMDEPKPQGVRAKREQRRKTPERTMRRARVKGRSWQRFQRDMNERIGRAWG